MGTTDYACESALGGELRLPPLGFLAESAQFVAFCSRNWNEVEFSSPTLFTLRSYDAKPLRKSRQIRVFHGFGDEKIRLRTNSLSIIREAIIDPEAQK